VEAMKMKRTTGMEATLPTVLLVSILVVSVLMVSVSPALGQGRSANNRTAKKSDENKKSAQKQTFAPRIEGRSESFIVEGSITACGSGAIRIKTAKGERATFEIDDQTTLLESGELVSISTLAAIELDPSDLQIFDRVEIIFEREGSRRLARIITRIQSESERVAKR
jgi:hypothetical protein